MKELIILQSDDVMILDHDSSYWKVFILTLPVTIPDENRTLNFFIKGLKHLHETF